MLGSRKTVALTGAGVSTESGIPDFRGKDGLWSLYDPIEYGTIGAFRRDPHKVWRMLTELLTIADARPNQGHLALATLEQKGLLAGIITQNIDGLHQKAGSSKVVEFHGSIDSFSCLVCRQSSPLARIRQMPLPLAVALVGVSARWITHSQFTTFRLEQTRSAFIDAATGYYQQYGSWDGAEVALGKEIDRILGVRVTVVRDHRADASAAAPRPAGVAPPPPEAGGPDRQPPPSGSSPAVSDAPAPNVARQLVLGWSRDRFERVNPFALANTAGVAVIGNHRWQQGETIPARVLAKGTPVTLDGQRIGTVAYDAPPELRSLERIFLRRTGLAISYAAIAAFALALAVGVLATRFFTRPIRDLTGAIRKMRSGDLEQTVVVRSNDEFGEMARAFNAMSAEVARSQRLREQMTADIAHDLRTPLSVLTGYLESIREGVLDASPEAVDTMYAEATQLQRLVEDLRTLSMADAGQLPLQRLRVGAHDLLQ
ncbi:MAG: Sir2 family NAD-dependent protein deacetylase, partial [Deltaproteobacteria bacterium]